jgi:hypothetical protein
LGRGLSWFRQRAAMHVSADVMKCTSMELLDPPAARDQAD